MDSYDAASRLQIPHETLEQAKFLKTIVDRIAVRIGAEYDNPVHTKSTDIINDFTISKVAVTKDTEVEIELPVGTKLVVIKSRQIGRLRIATSENETDDNGSYQTIGKGGQFSNSRSKLPAAKSLYCRCTTSDNILEVLIGL